MLISNVSVVDIEKTDGKCPEVKEHLLGKTAGFTHCAAYPSSTNGNYFPNTNGCTVFLPDAHHLERPSCLNFISAIASDVTDTTAGSILKKYVRHGRQIKGNGDSIFAFIVPVTVGRI